VEGAFADGTKFVDLSAIHTAQYVVAAIAQVLGVRERPEHSLLDEVVLWIGERRLLLVLDNCEHVLEARDAIERLLASCRHLTILATTRERFGLDAEEVVSIAPLGIPQDTQMLAIDEHLPDYPAVVLFIEYARSLQGELTLTPVAIRTIARICAQLDGIPLAIELAAARAGTLPPRSILAQLTGSPGKRFFDIMRQVTSHANSRHPALRDALAWSYHLLDAREQIVFRRASVFAAGWTPEALESLCGPHQLDIQSIMSSLANKSLVQQEAEADGTVRYRMHYVMRAFGKEMLAERREESTVLRQLAGYYTTLVESLEQRLTGTGQAESLGRLVQEYENIRLVLQWAREQQAVETGLRISGSLWWFFENRGYLTEGRDWVEGMLAMWQQHPDAASDDVVARAYYAAAILAVTQGDGDKGRSFAEASLARMRDPGKRARVLLMLGNLAKRRGDAEAALSLYTEGLAYLREAGDTKGVVVALNNLSTLHIERGDLEQALPLLEESISRKRELGDRRGEAVGLMNQGELFKAQGHYSRAMATTEAGLTIFASLEDSQGEALAYNNLGEIAEAAGDDEQAEDAYQKSVATYRRIEDRPGTAMVLEHLGKLMRRRGDARSAGYLQEAAILSREMQGDV
jgi:predicted ATPase